jgi:hypothetical protein
VQRFLECVMIQITPHMAILVAVDPIDFRAGIDGLVVSLRQACMKMIYGFVNLIEQFNVMRSRVDGQDDRSYASDGAW